MSISLLTRRRTVHDQEIREPTLLALALAIVGIAVLTALSAAAIAFVPAFGYIGWTFAAVAVVLAWLVLGLFRKPKLEAPAPTGRQRWLHRSLVFGRLLLSGMLAVWLGLFLWLLLCPSGPNAPPKANSTVIRIISWNIHCGQEKGLPWKQFDWPVRKHSLQAALDQAHPDILCVQEATPEQVAFLEAALPDHQRVGVGRDDGKSAGEHCAIYFDKDRFEALGNHTFWLEHPIDQPRLGSALDIKRICTWVRLRDRINQRVLRVYNTHLYLTEGLRLTAAQIILADIAAGDPNDAVVLSADFNAAPSAPSRRLFTEAMLKDSAALAGKTTGQATFQLYGIGLWCIDGILVDKHWAVHKHLILDVKPQNTFPSDHFALLADLGFAR